MFLSIKSESRSLQCDSTHIASSPGALLLALAASERRPSPWYGSALASNGSSTVRACTGGKTSPHCRHEDSHERQRARRLVAGLALTVVGAVPLATHPIGGLPQIARGWTRSRTKNIPGKPIPDLGIRGFGADEPRS
ncbi:hypothetical protein DAEQUDRAFT_431562 [Daedalea quercina L-15889]|uniref:Uncharacterized protein n=1 Tax=Daedalea quercina L-15889 TaxID=1314783 RepID=A0A165NG03_9APHY|nr:hypothetical protein DAEQUDRAFT_431562 [Daedalea quercina L-15889]